MRGVSKFLVAAKEEESEMMRVENKKQAAEILFEFVKRQPFIKQATCVPQGDTLFTPADIIYSIWLL